MIQCLVHMFLCILENTDQKKQCVGFNIFLQQENDLNKAASSLLTLAWMWGTIGTWAAAVSHTDKLRRQKNLFFLPNLKQLVKLLVKATFFPTQINVR